MIRAHCAPNKFSSSTEAGSTKNEEAPGSKGTKSTPRTTIAAVPGATEHGASTRGVCQADRFINGLQLTPVVDEVLQEFPLRTRAALP